MDKSSRSDPGPSPSQVTPLTTPPTICTPYSALGNQVFRRDCEIYGGIHGNLLKKAHKLSALIGQQAKVHICPVCWSKETSPFKYIATIIKGYSDLLVVV